MIGMFNWHIKESPILSLLGVGGGIGSKLTSGGGGLSLDVTGTATATVDLAGGESFNYNTMGPYTVTVSGSGAVLVKMWGASGGGYSGPGQYTGAGGYATGVLEVEDGDVYIVVVGAGGGAAPTYGNPGNAPLPYGGGGGGGPYNAAGGGFSGIFETPSDPGVNQTNARITSGGGGGRYSTTNLCQLVLVAVLLVSKVLAMEVLVVVNQLVVLLVLVVVLLVLLVE